MAKLKNIKQERFCHEYIKTGNATQAAIDAGYSKTSAKGTASRMLTNANFKHIPERIAEITAKSAKNNNLIADAEEVLEFFSKTFRNELKAKGQDDEGKTIEIDINVETKDRLKAAEMLGKKYAMFTDNMNVKAEIKQSKITEAIQAIKDSK